MKVYSLLLMTIWAAVQACQGPMDACPNCESSHYGDGFVYQVSYGCYTDYDVNVNLVAACNFLCCNCDRCEPGCSSCQAASGFGGALAPGEQGRRDHVCRVQR